MEALVQKITPGRLRKVESILTSNMEREDKAVSLRCNNGAPRVQSPNG